MCGIIGYTGHRPAVPVCMEGLRRLEYRGYDSAGLAFVRQGALETVRAKGKLAELDKELESAGNVFNSTSSIAHTRWATHGEPNVRNAHPHMDAAGRIAMAHNGIIENFQELRSELEADGITMASDTDTEVLVQLIGKYFQEDGDLGKAVARALKRADGAYAIVVYSLDNPAEIWAARMHSPLVLGVGTGENILASDIPAFLPWTRNVVFIDDGEMVRIDPKSWTVYDTATMEEKTKEVQTINWDVQAAQKGGFKHFMLKEIFEQPRVIRDCLTGRLNTQSGEIRLPEIEDMDIPDRLVIVACGTSYHAGLWSKYVIEKLARVPVNVNIASEFRYADPMLRDGNVILAISQSGETADTLAGMKLARSQNIPVMGLCNVVGSTVSRESDRVMYTQAGPEISVASTKAMCSQMVVLMLLALYWGTRKGLLSEDDHKEAISGLAALPEQLDSILEGIRSKAKSLAKSYSDVRSFMYLGRGACYPLALEGALKLKEISYIHAEGYAAGEMKHGPIALIDPEFPSFALALDDELFPKVKSNLIEVQARSGKIIALVNPGSDLQVDSPWELPKVWGPLSAFMALPALQLFSYEVADYLGKDVDQPRNLAKSVTVE